jgi:hypothetical protein
MRIRATRKGARLLHTGRRLRIAALAANLHSLAPERLAKLAEAVEILRALLAGWN